MAERSNAEAADAAAKAACGPLTLIGDCRCRGAVTRAYDGLVRSGVPERTAEEAAVRVYRFHHPDVGTDHAAEVVQIWLHAGRVH